MQDPRTHKLIYSDRKQIRGCVMRGVSWEVGEREIIKRHAEISGDNGYVFIILIVVMAS